ncbi:hypothetical protein MIR68_010548 [Amoeboaphelidium protococcarum]|nr:hypothetical protein MIR68_010548 [Amoeboaphelidium protococcarum]KAI3647698.1 hypothetical protein MP228_007919 [Amoeboaphelidium protococcarum]
MTKIQTTNTEKAPKAIGPYSQAKVYNGMVFCSGQIPLKLNGEILSGDVTDQARLAIDNLKNVLEASNSDLDHVLKTTVFLKDMNDFARVNEVYATYFPNKPARSAIEVARLPKDVLFEIEAVAVQKEA